jgi:hypothetical protein
MAAEKNGSTGQSCQFPDDGGRSFLFKKHKNDDIENREDAGHVKEIIIGNEEQRVGRDQEQGNFPRQSGKISLQEVHGNREQKNAGQEGIILSPQDDIAGEGPGQRRKKGSRFIFQKQAEKEKTEQGKQIDLEKGGYHDHQGKVLFSEDDHQELDGIEILQIRR